MKSRRRLGPPKMTMMDPWYTRMSCKPEGRPEVMWQWLKDACRGMLEHAPTLTSSIARRGASVSGCSAAMWTTASWMTRRGRKRRQERQPSSRPSSVTMTRLRDHLAASTTTHLTLTASACVLARGRQDDPQSYLQGIEATPSHVGGS